MSKHTILLIQKTKELESRTFTDHESVDAALRSLLDYFEAYYRRSKKLPPTGGPALEYTTKELFEYLDASLHDLSALVFDKSTKQYAPFNRDWLKRALYQMLSRAPPQRK